MNISTILNRKHLITLTVFLLSFKFIGAQTEIIKEGDVWYYYDQKDAPNPDWKTIKTNDNTWKTKKTPMGYGDTKAIHKIGFGGDSENKIIAYYFKNTFQVNNPYDYIAYRVETMIDDGAVIYLNGREVGRINMPNKPIEHVSLASSTVVKREMESFWPTTILPSEDLIKGENTISVSVHQGTLTSEDILFSLKLFGDNNSQALSKVLEKGNLRNQKLNLELKELQFKNEIDKIRAEKEIYKRIQNTYKWLFIGLLFVVLALVGYAFFIRHSFTRKQKQLVESLDDFKKINTRKDVEMMSNSLKSLDHKRYLQELKRDLDKVVRQISDFDSKRDLKNIINHIEFNIDQSKDNNNLKKHFNSVYNDFFNKLKKLYPELTEIDLRHCMFIKLHMQTKEIANILHVDPRSVQAARYRIKKKMNLQESTDLKAYLQEF